MMVRSLDTITTAPARTAEPQNPNPSPEETPRLNAAGVGNDAPGGGEDLPSPQPVEIQDIARAAERLKELARHTARALEFHVDSTSGRTVITVINAATQEVVRQIPAEEVLALARSMRTFGSVIDAEA